MCPMSAFRSRTSVCMISTNIVMSCHNTMRRFKRIKVTQSTTDVYNVCVCRHRLLPNAVQPNDQTTFSHKIDNVAKSLNEITEENETNGRSGWMGNGDDVV